jgi:Fur family peroxide stress response transcriptional regulator
MNASHWTEQQIEELMRNFSAVCRRIGLKLTHQRTEIYRVLLNSIDHPSAEALHKRILIRIPSMSLDTVYRTLATLEQHGLIERIQTVESQARFEVVFTPHHHLICSRCKQIMDFCWPDLDHIILPAVVGQWGRIDSKTVVMYGTCKQCAEAE